MTEFTSTQPAAALATTPAQLRKFAISLSVKLVIFFTLVPFLFKGVLYLWPSCLVILLLSLAAVWPPAIVPVQKLWHQLGKFLGLVNASVVLGVFFIFIFSPIALWRRIRGVDPLHRKPDPKLNTYRVPRTPQKDKRSMEMTF